MKNVFEKGHGQYKKPEMTIIPFEEDDIIRTSDYGDDHNEWGEWEVGA